MNVNSPVSEIMSAQVVVASTSNKFSQVLDLFVNYDMHHLPIVDDGALVGIVSYTDILRFFLNHMNDLVVLDMQNIDNEFSVKDLMTPDPHYIAPEATIERAILIMREHKIQSVPVVNDTGIIGIVTARDIAYKLDQLA